MMAKNIPESVIKLQAWGSLSTPMLATYAHLSNEQQDAFLMAAEGAETERKVKMDSALKPSACPACGASNPVGMEYCGICSAPIDPVRYQEKLKADGTQAATIAAMQEQMALLLEHYESWQNLRMQPGQSYTIDIDKKSVKIQKNP